MKKLTLVFERLTLGRVISLWLMTVVVFSLAYYGLSYTANQHLIYNGQSLGTDALGLGNAIYFSFVTATTIGYGDIAPAGIAKVLAIIEAIASITLFGVLIAKIVSIKQEEILEEIKEISIEEATNSAISESYLFRNSIASIKQEIESSKKPKKASQEFEHSLESLRHALIQFNNAKISTENTTEARLKALMHISLASNSINFSLSRLVELLEAFNTKKIDWKKESTTPTIAEAQRLLKTLYEQYNVIRTDDELSKKVGEKLEDLNKTLATMQKSF